MEGHTIKEVTTRKKVIQKKKKKIENELEKLFATSAKNHKKKKLKQNLG